MSEFGGFSSIVFAILGAIGVYVNNKLYIGHIVEVLFAAKIYDNESDHSQLHEGGQ